MGAMELYKEHIEQQRAMPRCGIGVLYPFPSMDELCRNIDMELTVCQSLSPDSAARYGSLRDLYGMVLLKAQMSDAYQPSKQDKEVFGLMEDAFRDADCVMPYVEFGNGKGDSCQFVSPDDIVVEPGQSPLSYEDFTDRMISAHPYGQVTDREFKEVKAEAMESDHCLPSYWRSHGPRYVKPTVERLSDPECRAKFAPMWTAMLDYQMFDRSDSLDEAEHLSKSRYGYRQNVQYINHIISGIEEKYDELGAVGYPAKDFGEYAGREDFFQSEENWYCNKIQELERTIAEQERLRKDGAFHYDSSKEKQELQQFREEYEDLHGFVGYHKSIKAITENYDNAMEQYSKQAMGEINRFSPAMKSWFLKRDAYRSKGASVCEEKVHTAPEKTAEIEAKRDFAEE